LGNTGQTRTVGKSSCVSNLTPVVLQRKTDQPKERSEEKSDKSEDDGEPKWRGGVPIRVRVGEIALVGLIAGVGQDTRQGNHPDRLENHRIKLCIYLFIISSFIFYHFDYLLIITHEFSQLTIPIIKKNKSKVGPC
jgi:hypothetical protein